MNKAIFALLVVSAMAAMLTTMTDAKPAPHPLLSQMGQALAEENVMQRESDAIAAKMVSSQNDCCPPALCRAQICPLSWCC